MYCNATNSSKSENMPRKSGWMPSYLVSCFPINTQLTELFIWCKKNKKKQWWLSDLEKLHFFLFLKIQNLIVQHLNAFILVHVWRVIPAVIKVIGDAYVRFFAATVTVPLTHSYDKIAPLLLTHYLTHTHTHISHLHTQWRYCHPSLEWSCDFYQACYCQLFFRMEKGPQSLSWCMAHPYPYSTMVICIKVPL